MLSRLIAKHTVSQCKTYLVNPSQAKLWMAVWISGCLQSGVEICIVHGNIRRDSHGRVVLQRSRVQSQDSACLHRDHFALFVSQDDDATPVQHRQCTFSIYFYHR